MKIAICDDELLHLQHISKKIEAAFNKADPYGEHLYKKYRDPLVLLSDHEKMFLMRLFWTLICRILTGWM